MEEDISEATELQRVQNNQEAINYGVEQIGGLNNQLELMSQASGPNSIMNSSPARPQRRARTKGKIAS